MIVNNLIKIKRPETNSVLLRLPELSGSSCPFQFIYSDLKTGTFFCPHRCAGKSNFYPQEKTSGLISSKCATTSDQMGTALVLLIQAVSIQSTRIVHMSQLK